MTATGWSLPRIGGCIGAAFLALPGPLPVPTPSLLPSVQIPSPSVPVGIATPSVPALGATPGNQAPTTAANPVQQSNAGAPVQATRPAATSAPSGGSPPGGIPIPFTAIYVSSPLDIALLATLATLPLLFGIWLLLFGRTFAEARRARDAQVRLMLAADLGLHPRDLASMSTRSLFDLREKSAFDELTGVLRRAAGVAAAEREMARARRHSTPLTVAFIDVDGLKEANDARGHAAGDAMLRGLTAALKEGLRAEDIVLRYGGDEFVCVMPGMAVRDARAKLSDIQDGAAAAGIRFCVGLAQLQRPEDVVALFARADRELYEFKARRGEIVPLPSRSRQDRDEDTVTA